MTTTGTPEIVARWQAKSETVTAIQVAEDNGPDVLRFCGIPEVPGLAATVKALPGPGGNRMPVKLRAGDWIVKHADRINGDHFTVHGPAAFGAAYESADPFSDPMFGKTYMEVQAVLDKALGTEEEDGAGAGITADVWLLAHQRDEARAQVAQLAARLKDLTEPGLIPAAGPARVTTDWCVAWGGEDANDCAGRLEYDDEAEARDMAQWIDGGIVARQTVVRLPWVNVPDETTDGPCCTGCGPGCECGDSPHDATAATS
jgi:hypothetical protein